MIALIEKDIRQLREFQKEIRLRNMTLVRFEAQTREALKNIINGCVAMVEIEKVLGDRVDNLNKRIDIANKRIRLLEEAK